MSATSVQDRVHASLERLVAKNHSRWVLCLSGGLDSRVLLHLCVQSARRLGATLSTIHVHHGLRESADHDAAIAREVAHSYGVHHTTVHLELDQERASQESARAARWSAVVQECARRGARCALSAHHEDDAFETMLMNATRGAGAKGLSALAREVAPMPYGPAASAGFIVWRPLVSSARAELEAIASRESLTWAEDPSNATDAYARNRVRHHVLPALLAENGAREGLRATLRNLAAIADQEAHQAKSLLAMASRDNYARPMTHCFAREMLAATNEHALMSALLMAKERAGVSEAWSRAHLEALVSSIHRAGARVETLPGAVVELDRTHVRITPSCGKQGARALEQRAHPIKISFRDRAAGRVPWFGGEIAWEVVAREAIAKEPWSAREIILDRDAIQGDLLVRGPLAGETMRVEEDRALAIKEILRASGVPALDRWWQGVLCDDRGALWVVGHRRGYGAWVEGKTARVVRMIFGERGGK